ncbi:MAG: hypothetical protein ACYDAP_05955 [Thermoplasmataceae archaeon]
MEKIVSAQVRKIIKMNNSYYVNLPHGWISQHELKGRSAVIVQINNDGEIRVKAIEEGHQ